jgi:hypothetical protein
MSLGSNELQISANAVADAGHRIFEFRDYVRLFHEAEKATLLRRLAEPASENPSPPDPNNQTPSKS